MVAESTAKTRENCSRCAMPLEREPAVVLVESGPLHSAHAIIKLCPYCTDSLTRWFARGHGSGRADRSSKPSAPSEAPSRERRHRRRSHRTRQVFARGAFAVAIALVVLATAAFVLYEFYVITTHFLGL
jgi:hypothetical protein